MKGESFDEVAKSLLKAFQFKEERFALSLNLKAGIYFISTTGRCDTRLEDGENEANTPKEEAIWPFKNCLGSHVNIPQSERSGQ